MLLSDEEIRVLGCLVEKSLATPQQYPLSEAAVQAAANQTTNRDPVVDYDQGTVRRALLDLRAQGLAKLVQRPADRTPKHRHLLDEALDLDEGEVALLGLLLLRGPQTVAELRVRSERLHRFPDGDAAAAALDGLAARDEPLVQRIGRRPGQKEDRYAHLLQGDLVEHGILADPRDASGPAAHGLGDVDDEATGPPRTLAALLGELAALRERVTALELRVAALDGGSTVEPGEPGTTADPTDA